MTAKKRKIVQIAIGTSGSSHEMYAELIVLCDDGTLWARSPGYDNTKNWRQLPPVPNDISSPK